MAAIEDDRQPGGRASVGRRAAVLAELRRAPGGVAEVAARLGVHPNTVRLHVAALAADGLVEEAPARTPRGPGRPSLVYRATRRMPHGPDRYRELAGALLEALVHDDEAGTRALDAGRAWGVRVARAHDAVPSAERATADPSAERATADPSAERATADPSAEHATATTASDDLSALIAVLDDVGFAPERVPHGIALRQCPFLDLVEAPRMVVCRVHLGLMQGALAAWRSGAEVDRLEPFVEPDLCLAHVRRSGRRQHAVAS